MKQHSIIITLLLFTSPIITHAKATIEYDIDETRIYKINCYGKDIAIACASLMGCTAGCVSLGAFMLDRELNEQSSALFLSTGKIISASILAFSLKKYIESISSITKKLIFKRDVMLSISQKGITYDQSPLITWESIKDIQCIRYTTPHYNMLPYDYFDIAILTTDGLYIVINNHLLQVEFNWLFQQIHHFYHQNMLIKLQPINTTYPPVTQF